MKWFFFLVVFTISLSARARQAPPAQALQSHSGSRRQERWSAVLLQQANPTHSGDPGKARPALTASSQNPADAPAATPAAGALTPADSARQPQTSSATAAPMTAAEVQ